MGEDQQSPVDLHLRVKGVQGLRVADASVIPEIPVSALNAPSMMIGYRAAEFMLQDASEKSSQPDLQQPLQQEQAQFQQVQKNAEAMS